MKILFYIEHFREIGGAENYAVSLCMELYRRGYEICVVCRDGDEVDGIKIHHEFHDIKTLIKRVNYDISFDWGLFERAHISRLGGGIHRYFINYALYSYPIYLRPMKWLLYRVGSHRKKMKHQDYVLSSPETIFISPSNFIKTHALEYGISAERVAVLYNGVDLKRFSPPDDSLRKRIRKKWGIGEQEIVFLFVAHNLRLKNIRLLKRLFDKIHESHPMIRLMISGKRRPNFKRPYLIYTGFIKDMREIYGAADVLIHPSYFDTFGSVVLEAMASGLPVIVSDFVGASEIIGEAGIRLPVTGKGVLATWEKSIVKLLNQDLRSDMGKRARKIAEKYDFSTYVDKIEEIMKGL